MRKNILKIFMFIAILFLSPKVFALDYNVSNTITSPVAPSNNGTYTGEEQNGSTSSWNINTRYNGLLQRIRFNLPKPSGISGDCFYTNMNYKITMNMATEDWRNRFGTVRVVANSSSTTNWSNGRVTFVSTKKIYFTFKIPSTDTTCRQFVYVDLPSSATFTPFTGETNWNLQSVILSDELTDGGSGSGGGSGSANQDIINNANQNTQNIIDNSNQNTQDIIENNNQNTENIVNSVDKVNDSLSNCTNDTYTLKVGLNNNYLADRGVVYSNNGYYISDWLNIKPNTSYTFDIKNTDNNNIRYGRYCLYNKQKEVLSCGILNAGINNTVYTFTSSNDAYYFRTTLSKLVNNATFTGVVCTNVNDSINNISDTLNDNSDPNIADSEFTDLFNSVGFNDPLSYLLQLPVQFINQLVSQSNSCQTISLGTLWGVSLTLPCIDIGSIIGQQVWDIIDVLFSVGLLVVILKNLYQTFANLMTMGGEKEAREKFSMPTPMEFLSIVLGGDK